MIRILETRRLARWILAAGAVLAAACTHKTAPPDVASPSNPVQEPAPHHPLDPLTSREIESAVNALKAAGRLAEGMLFPILVLREPPKADVLARREGDPVRREAFAVVLDRKAKQTFEAGILLEEPGPRRPGRTRPRKMNPALLIQQSAVRAVLPYRGLLRFAYRGSTQPAIFSPARQRRFLMLPRHTDNSLDGTSTR